MERLQGGRRLTFKAQEASRGEHQAGSVVGHFPVVRCRILNRENSL
jgi:hypothetical protein